MTRRNDADCPRVGLLQGIGRIRPRALQTAWTPSKTLTAKQACCWKTPDEGDYGFGEEDEEDAEDEDESDEDEDSGEEEVSGDEEESDEEEDATWPNSNQREAAWQQVEIQA